MLNIVFGSVKTATSRVAEQELNHASVKLEASRGSGTSRRILFNRPACNLLDLNDGEAQEMLFGFAEADGESPARLFIVNTEDFSSVVTQKTYKTSKNKAAYFESKEKGKAISSRPLAAEISAYLGLEDDTQDVDFFIQLFEKGEANVYELSSTPFVLSEEPETTEEMLAEDDQPETKGLAQSNGPGTGIQDTTWEGSLEYPGEPSTETFHIG
tara:strand:- start:65 stop:703 length:639 start_codon:yes stop_codon:yes gene_type:complete